MPGARRAARAGRAGAEAARLVDADQPAPPSVDDAAAAFGVLAPAAPADAARPRTARAWIAAADAEADMPAFRLVPRFWLGAVARYHRLHGPRPGSATRRRSSSGRRSGSTACCAWPAPARRDATRRRGDDAAAAGAIEAAREVDAVVYDCVRGNPDASAATSALDAFDEAHRGRDASYEAVSEDEYAGLCAHYDDATPGGALRVYADPDGWRVADRVCDAGARQAVERHCAARDEYDEAPIRVCKLGASDSPPAADVLDDAFDDEVAVAVERGDARRRSRRSSRAPAARTFETVRLGSEDRVGLLLLKLCEAFPEMMDGGKKCFSCVLFYAVAAAAA